MEKMGMHCFVSGLVQGVWFRAATQEKAKALGVTGWAKNLQDGRVEVLAFGDKAALGELYEWLKIGPTGAKVSNVSYDDHEFQELNRFGIK